MNSSLHVDFELAYRRGPVIRAAWRQLLDPSSVTVLFGPSGCGKTTALRALAGLLRPDQGMIQYHDETWFDSQQEVDRSPQLRQVGFLFQDYALFPHLTVESNIGYGLRRAPREQRESRVSDLLKRFGLNELAGRHPRQLSGGQQQRVALARALANRPRLLLLDEPLSALDDPLRRELREELRELISEFTIPVVMVTHDRYEAMALADQLVVMESGRVLQTGTVEEVFSRPADTAVARIVGTETVVRGTVEAIEGGLATVAVGAERLVAVAPQKSCRNIHVCIKGEDVMLQRGASGDQSVRNRFSAHVKSIVPEGPLLRVHLDCGFSLSALVSRSACEELHLQVGDPITACVKAASIHLIAD